MFLPACSRAGVWRLKTRALTLGATPRLMGILNITPDSFSDGGRFLDPRQALDHAWRLIDEGADLIDVGGQSTRPYALAVADDEQLRRVMPVIERLAPACEIPISIDTSSSAVARQAVAAGAEIINDVTGLTGDPAMPALAAETLAGVCCMHMLGDPRTMQDDPRYENVVEEILEYLRRRRDALIAAGIAAERICVDPGIGFGKTHAHNLTLMANCHRFHALGQPLLVGHSRKAFLGRIIGDQEADRTAATIGAAVALAEQGVQIIRVHDVRPTREALAAYFACARNG